MKISFAPLEGITGWVYRSIHHAMFPGLDAYYAPFFAPTGDSPLTNKGLADLQPEHNHGLTLVPQLLTNRAEDFLAAAKGLETLGYREINWNLGCPSGTVTAKGKGAGFLREPERLDAFFQRVFDAAPDIQLSVKTRVGWEDEKEWTTLLEIFDRYPIRLLIIHPRVRQDFYREPVRLGAFAYAAEHSGLPLCYNGDLNTPADCTAIQARFPAVAGLMLGRGLIANPALGRQLQGGAPLEKGELRTFHDRLLEAYRETLSGERPVLGKMKELWFYHAALFDDPSRYMKAIRKSKSLADYRFAVDALFRDRDLRPDGGYFRP